MSTKNKKEKKGAATATTAATTPLPSLSGVVYGAVVSGKLPDAESLQHLEAESLTYGRQKYVELLKYAEDGNWSWRVAGFLVGGFCMASSFLEFWSNLFGLQPFYILLDVYIFLFGLLAVCLEYKDQMLTASYVAMISQEAHFLTTPYGRAAFYFFVGLLMVCKGGLLNWVGGLFACVVGVVIYRSSRRSYEALAQMRGSQENVDAVRSKFRAFDTARTGQLTTAQLAQLCASLGSTMTRQEIESALFILDTDGNGHVSEEEFVGWWVGHK